MNGIGTPRTREELDLDTRRRLTLQERRLLGSAGRVTPMSATLDPSYRGFGPAKVVVDGTLSTDAYDWLVPYQPNESRQVRLVSTGDTALIAGQGGDETIRLALNPAVADVYGDRAVDTSWNLRPRATKLALSGLVVLSGMLITIGTPPNSSVIATLPEGMRPEYIMAFAVEWGDVARSIYVHPNGDIVTSPAPGANAYLSLDGIAFHPAGVGTWTDVGAAGSGSSFGANFENWTNPAFGPCGYYKDPWGFVWFRGLVRVKTATSADNTPIVALPAAYRVNLQSHFRTTGQDAYAGLGGGVGDGLNWKLNSPGTVGNWISLTGAMFVTTDALALNPWHPIRAYANSWSRYGGTTYPEPAYVRREDGLAVAKGMIGGGTVGTKMASMVEEELWPSGGRIIVAAISNNARARLDVYAARDINQTDGGPGTLLGRGGTNNWWSWDGLKWVP